MKKSVKTAKAATAYKVLKLLKVKELSDEAGLAIWKNIKALRSTAETYEKDVKDVEESLKSDDDEKWQERAQKAQQLDADVQSGKAKYTADDVREQQELIKHFDEVSKKKAPRINELNDAVVEIEVTTISDTDMLKAIKVNDLNVGTMDELDFLLNE